MFGREQANNTELITRYLRAWDFYTSPSNRKLKCYKVFNGNYKEISEDEFLAANPESVPCRELEIMTRQGVAV